VMSVWRTAGHAMKKLRFDREPGVITEGIKGWLLDNGVELIPTAAGQKVGLIEVLGRICKDKGRSTLAGIRARFGYEFPKRFMTKMHADVVAMTNRLPRPGCNMSPCELFFGRKCLDVRRDLRVAMGEILLFKRPKRGVSSPMGEYKAEWGIVIGRAFNASGVVEVYLLETGAAAHRFKFVRNVTIPPYEYL